MSQVANQLSDMENLPALPNGWVWTRLENCVDILDEKRVPVSADERKKRKGSIPYYGATGQAGWIDDYLFDEELVLVGEDGAPFLEPSKTKAYIIRGKSWVNNHAHVLRAITGIASNLFVCHYLNTFDYNGFVSGTTRLKLNQSPLRRIPLPLPPLPEQHRIVAKIEELFTRLDAGVEALNKTKAQLKRYRQAVLRDAFQGKLTQEWREVHKGELEPASVLLECIKEERRKNAKGKYEELPPLDTSDLPELPEGWRWATVGEIAYVVSGQTPKGINDGSFSGDIPYFKIGDMNKSGNEKYMFHSDITLDFKQANELRLKIHEIGTVIFPKRGGAIGTNKKRILAQPSAYDLNTMGVLTVIIPHQFFYYWIFHVDLSGLSDGSNVPQINHSDIEPLVFPVPSLLEQYAIIEVIERLFSVADEVEKTVDQNLKQAERLRQSILRRAFEGKLISQDPADEPAEKLLERIKEEREQWQQAKREITKQGRRNTNTKQMELI